MHESVAKDRFSNAKPKLNPSTDVFIPKVSSDYNASQSEIQRRDSWVSKLTASDVSKIEEKLFEKWSAYKASLPTFVPQPLSVAPPEDYVLQEFWLTVESYVKATLGKNRPLLVPKVESGYLASQVQKQDRDAWISRLDSSHEAVIDKMVQDKWVSYKGGLRKACQSNLPEQAPLAFVEEEYWNVVEEIAKQMPFAFQADPWTMNESSSSSTHRGDDNMVYGISSLVDDSAFDKEAVCTEEPVGDFASSRMLLEGSYTSSNGIYEGWLLSNDPEERQVQVPVRGNASSPAKRSVNGEMKKQEKTVLDLLLLDNTGPIIVTLWGTLATEFLMQRQNVANQKPDCSKILVKLQNFRIAALPKNDWNGESLTAIKILHSKETLGTKTGSILSVSTTASSPYISSGSFEVPSVPACISNYASVRAKMARAPFRGTFFGTIVEVEDMQETQSGQGKKYFAVADSSGCWIPFCAVAHNATSKALRVGNQVVLFFASARSAIGDARAALYLFKDAVIVQIQKKSEVLPTKRSQIDVE